MRWWDYERISHAADCWAEARRALPMNPREPGKPDPHAIRKDGSGPQFAPQGTT